MYDPKSRQAIEDNQWYDMVEQSVEENRGAGAKMNKGKPVLKFDELVRVLETLNNKWFTKTEISIRLRILEDNSKKFDARDNLKEGGLITWSNLIYIDTCNFPKEVFSLKDTDEILRIDYALSCISPNAHIRSGRLRFFMVYYKRDDKSYSLTFNEFLKTKV